MRRSAKLAEPRLAAVCVRPRLDDVIERLSARPLLWIGGPAGSGKSTALASYLQRRKLGHLWYAVDARDHDAANLFHFLDEGVPAGEDESPLSRFAIDDPTRALAFARRYFDTFFERLTPPFWLVFDDCHLLPQEHAWFDLLREGLELLPEGIHVALLSRRAPPQAFSRFRATSRLGQVGWEQLRFSSGEATELMQRRVTEARLSLSSRQMTELAARSGGWAAGLILALERARLAPDGLVGVQTFISPDYFDYFAAEVLAAVSPEDRKFLLTSSVVPTMTSELLESVLDRSDMSSRLARLERDDFFATAYATSACIGYRYHPLFRDFLLARLEQELPVDEVKELRLRAAAALEVSGEVDSAFDLYREAGDDRAGGRLIEREAPRLLTEGRAQTVKRWIERLPGSFVEKSPWLGFWSGMAALGHEPLRSVPLLDDALTRFEAACDSAGYWSAWCGLVQAHAFAGQDYRPLGTLIDRAYGALDQGFAPPTEALNIQMTRALVMAMHLRVPMHPDFFEHLQRWLASPYRDGEDQWIVGIALGSRGLLTGFDSFFGDLGESELDDSAPATLWWTTAEAARALLSGDFGRCIEVTRIGIDAAERMGFSSHAEAVLIYRAMAQLNLGEQEGFAATLVEFSNFGRRNNLFGASGYHFIQTIAALRIGDDGRALQMASLALSQSTQLGMPFGEAASHLVYTEALLGAGRVEEAQAHWELVRDLVECIGPLFRQSALLVSAELAGLRGHEELADELLAEGLILGEMHGFFPYFSPRPAALRSLCQRALARSISPVYVTELLWKFGLEKRPVSGFILRSDTGAVPREFSKAVQGALRFLHETHKLTESSLLASRVVQERIRDTDRSAVFALQALLQEQVAALQRNERTQAWYQALHHSFIEPAGKQLLAAERACLSFGSFRRHLTAGVAEVATNLWLREQELAGASSKSERSGRRWAR